MSEYYLVRNGQTIGPFPLANLPGYQLRPQDVVWKEGFQSWIPASDVKEIAEFMKWQGNAPMMGQPQTQPFSANPRPQVQSAGLSGTVPKRQTGLLVMGIIGIIFALVQSFLGVVFIAMGIEFQDRYYYNDFSDPDLGAAFAGMGAFIVFLGILFLVICIIAVVNASQKRIKV